MTVEIVCADARKALAAMPAGSVHACITSPPYWGLRDYGLGPDALGLEPTPELYVEHIVQVMREVWRVLRDDGTLWLNLGFKWDGRGNCIDTAHMVRDAVVADGWYFKAPIVWAKRNTMPESVRKRPTSAHEMVFLMAKHSQTRYYYDQDAIREPKAESTVADPRMNENGHRRERGYPGAPSAGGTNLGGPQGGRNKRSVWEIATQPYPGAHFAVFPEKLVEPCILAGTSEWGCCPECGAPWERVVEKGIVPHDAEAKYPVGAGERMGKARDALRARGKNHDNPFEPVKTTGWRPTCDHDDEPVPCTVLDPFAGSGTVGLVAERLGRHSVLIDASEDYCWMARERTAQMGLMEQSPPH